MIVGILVFAVFLSLVVAMLYDFDCAYAEAQHEADVDALWDEDEPVLEVVA